jgi:ATP-dependent DNA ligase
MLAKPSADIPAGEGWLYEPKWDGFRAIVFRDGGRIHIASRNALPLERYFPELVEVFAEALPEQSVVDGEIIIAGPNGLEFETLQLRLHPAASRVRMLAKETPASFVAFDLLGIGDEDLRREPLTQRRARLIASVHSSDRCFVTPQTSDRAAAAMWFERFEGAGLDGVVAKRATGPYVEGERVMVKVKHSRTADCVVGGYRLSKDGKTLGSLLLGLYADGTLHHVGHTSAFNAAQRREILALLQPLQGAESFTGEYGPGGPSRWSQGRDMAWVPVQPKLVCEVAFDHLQGGHRFRHATRFLHWRPDKDPADCTFHQLEPPHPFELSDIVKLGTSSGRGTR